MDRAEVVRLAAELTDGVMCDGFHGYLFNTDDDPRAALEALETIGAHRAAEIARHVFGRFPGGMPPSDRFERQIVLDEVAPRTDEFDAEDEAFFAYPDDVERLVESYGGAN